MRSRCHIHGRGIFVSGLFFCAVAAPPEKKAKLPLRKALESLTTPTFSQPETRGGASQEK